MHDLMFSKALQFANLQHTKTEHNFDSVSDSKHWNFTVNYAFKIKYNDWLENWDFKDDFTMKVKANFVMELQI